jgi:hypothetical protein
MINADQYGFRQRSRGTSQRPVKLPSRGANLWRKGRQVIDPSGGPTARGSPPNAYLSALIIQMQLQVFLYFVVFVVHSAMQYSILNTLQKRRTLGMQ